MDRQDEPFYGIIMAAMRKADTDNLVKLQTAWPDVWAELTERHRCPGGRLPMEVPVESALQAGADLITGIVKQRPAGLR